MPTTLVQPLPYPEPGAVPDVPADLKLLAEAVETRGVMRFPSIAARDAALPTGSRLAGMLAFVEATQAYYAWSTNGTPGWRPIWSGQGDLALTMSNGFVGTAGGGWLGMTVRSTGPLVIINGLFTRATSWGAGETIGTVPSGWAPPRREKGNGADVMSDGSVVAEAAGAANALVSCKVVYALPLS